MARLLNIITVGESQKWATPVQRSQTAFALGACKAFPFLFPFTSRELIFVRITRYHLKALRSHEPENPREKEVHMRLRRRTLIQIPALSLLFVVMPALAQSFDFRSIDVPCSACPGGIAFSTSAQGINPAGDIVGSYTDTTGTHGFLLSGGQFTSIDVPGSLMGVGGTLPTGASAINASGEIIGTYIAPVSMAAYGSP
jgi:hypothetical protein